MYEENCKPLPPGDASVVFARQLAAMRRGVTVEPAAKITPQSVLRRADKRNQHHFATMCRRLLLPGSGIVGIDNLGLLAKLAGEGKACLVCFNHRSNLDVPNLFTLMEDQADPKLFHRIIWISGRKLEEDSGMTTILVRCFNRVIVTPHTWFASRHSEDEIHAARLVNIAAERSIAQLRYEGWVFALFPSGTRIRPDDESTAAAIEETDGYLRMFEYLALCNIDGCTMPVTRDRDLTRETPKLDRVIYKFEPVERTEEYRAKAAARFPGLDQRSASACAITEDLAAFYA